MKKYILLSIATIMFAACGKDNHTPAPTPTPTPDPDPVVDEKIPVNLRIGIDTKVTDTAFESGDQVGIYMVNYVNGVAGTLAVSGNAGDNIKDTYTTNWNLDQKLFWANKNTKADFYAYYPYGHPTSVSAYLFSTKTDQRAAADYKASDFIWGKAAGIAPTEETIDIATRHMLSNMVISVVPGDGFTAESLAVADMSVRVPGVKPDALVNLATGEVSATGKQESILPYKTGDVYKAMIVPQTVAEGSDLICVTVDNMNYTVAMGFTFVGGMQHQLTVTVNKSSSGINISIVGWDSDDIDNGGVAE